MFCTKTKVADIGAFWVQVEVQGQMEVQVQLHMQGLVIMSLHVQVMVQ